MRISTLQILIWKIWHIFLLICDRIKTQPDWQKTGASSPITQKIFFFQCSHKFFSFSMKQQNSKVYPLTTAGFLDGEEVWRKSWFGRGTLWIVHPVSWSFEFHRDVIPSFTVSLLCEQVFCQYIMDLESLERVLLLEVPMKCGGCGKSQPVCELSFDFQRCFYADPISCVSPWLTGFAAVLVCESWGMGQEGKAPHCLLDTTFHL